MTKKNRKGRVCFILLNCILLLLGVCMLISTIYVMNDTTFIPVAKELPSVWEIAILASIALVILSVFGFGASCGGCTLYFYLMITLLLNILLFAGSIAAFLVFFALKTPTSENGIAHLVNTTIARWGRRSLCCNRLEEDTRLDEMLRVLRASADWLLVFEYSIHRLFWRYF